MFRLRRWYNQNSKTLWKLAGIIVFLIIILRVLNYFAAKQNNLEYINTTTQNVAKKDYTDVSIKSDKSVLSPEKNVKPNPKPIETINAFFSSCNKGDFEKAYNLLTDECKERMYPKLNDFKEKYYNRVFNGEKKNISLENWIGNIYKVEISDDILTTGIYDEGNIRQDYITIQEIEDNYKLNINGYIDTEEINKTNTKNDSIDISVSKKDIYIEYEIYYFTIKNNSDSPILLDNLAEIDSMYIEDKNNIKYTAYTHEISKSELLINSRESRTLKIKYYNRYGSEKRIKRAVFSKVITDYNLYKSLIDQTKYENYYNITIDV